MIFLVQKIILFLLLITSWVSNVNAQQLALQWSPSELKTLKQFSLSNLKPVIDKSNNYLNNADAINFGELLFNDKRLSNNQSVSCGGCHLKNKGFTDNKMVALGVRSGLRNTPTLLNIGYQNWFFWDGNKDSLWSQAISSMENPAEHNFSRVQAFKFISNNYKSQYQALFKKLPKEDELKKYPDIAGPNGDLDALKAWKKLTREKKHKVNQVITNIGKTIAAYVSTIKTKSSSFDRFIEEVTIEGSSTLLTYSQQKGLKLFINKQAGCSNCHSGAIFSNKEFHNIGTGIPAKDNGRSEVIDAVLRDKFNCLGKFSDAKPGQCMELTYATRDKHSLSGYYKTPTLRGLSKTAPYMHDGRFINLKAVINYYASFNHSDKVYAVDLPVVTLSKENQQHLVSFLLTL